MTDHSQWTKELAAGLAAAEDTTLTDAHWKVLNYSATDYAEKGAVPGMRRMDKVGGIPTKELCALFPNGPINKGR
jgi:sulfur relay (sulfurtransferase) DsrC/TusE family protein